MSQSFRILAGLIIGLTLGILAGWLFQPAGPLAAHSAALGWWIEEVIQPLGRVFLRIIFMVIIPLNLSAIVIGTMEMGDIRTLGRIGVRTLAITLLLSTLSVMIALGLVNALQPGKALNDDWRDALVAAYSGVSQKNIERGELCQSLSKTLLNFIPENPLAEAVNSFNPDNTGGGLLAVMVFSLFVGIAMTVAPREKTAALRGVFEGMFEVSMVIIGFALKLAPLGVACLSFAVAARLGLDLFRTLGYYTAIVLLGLSLHQFVVLLVLLGCRSPVEFFRGANEAIAIILGIDRFLDMCRTALNVTGDLVIAAVVSRGETADEAPRMEAYV